MKINKIFKAIICGVIFLSSVTISANDLNDGNEDVEDQAPISDYVPVMLLCGVAAAFVLLKKRQLR